MARALSAQRRQMLDNDGAINARTTDGCAIIPKLKIPLFSLQTMVWEDNGGKNKFSMGRGERETIIGICGGVGPAAGLLLHQSILTHTCTVDRTAFLVGNDPGKENPAEGMSRTLEMLLESGISRKANAIVGVFQRLTESAL